jgi:hypothetical protein
LKQNRLQKKRRNPPEQELPFLFRLRKKNKHQGFFPGD